MNTDLGATARHCDGSRVQVWQGTGPTVLDAFSAVIDALSEGDDPNPCIVSCYVWDDPGWQPGDDRIVVMGVETP